MTHTERTGLAATALRAIADRLERASEVAWPGHPPTLDDYLTAMFDPHDLWMTRLAQDPSAIDGWLTWCPVCDSEAHGADCPVQVLVDLWEGKR